MSRKRIALIVDHPLRDLDGLILLAAELGARGHQAMLVPMYCKEEVFLLKPDFVLVNYARPANVALIRACHAAGIQVGVLDTEGGIIADMPAFAERLSAYFQDLDLYCTWGAQQRDALQARVNGHGMLVRQTGSPRYDFAVEPWRARAQRARPLVLFNSSFPLCNPRFQDPEAEIQEVVKLGYDEAWVRERMEHQQRALHAMVEAALAVARALPEFDFVLRPHPFENADVYRQAFAAVPNLEVRQAGTVFSQLRDAVAVLHYHCSTAIDGFLAGCEPYQLDWIDAPAIAHEITSAVSRKAASVDQLVAELRQLAAGQPGPVPENVRAARQQIVHDYFGPSDGQASRRAADAIEETLGRRARPAAAPLLAFWREHKWRTRGKLAVLLLLGAGQLDRVRGVDRASAKHFDSAQVQQRLLELARVAPRLNGLRARPAGRRNRRRTVLVER